MWWENMKMKLIVFGIVVALILLIVLTVCKDFNCWWREIIEPISHVMAIAKISFSLMLLFLQIRRKHKKGKNKKNHRECISITTQDQNPSFVWCCWHWSHCS